MKTTGIVRNLDSLGRVVIPMELRRTLNIESGDPIEVFVNGDQIVLRKYSPGCAVTGSTEDLIEFNGKQYSREAIRQLAKQAEI
ncbi:AbrB/MazE/SpoVT family DNA-binding domain-containing protein [Paenibacillus sp. GCM10012307]|uniref:AbrB/MazE/SpoVT family DNA-binding domain-containing protein n=1 Tax=Paenibacillus roseus TaxID=2798579 RepID=A0A934IWZ3_9BACL|nr:AbrB/MazE/SpoVT family DNA-binding domain-containing protein [Paenibacillus roseus]MBJ6360826.1 AbrB/MazE/SpoVT family DNA-binding domain-containing protein [Paenibacillus roseus]